jgi:hypothetical protein
VKCITNESSAGAVENENGSDLIPRGDPVLARFEKAHNSPRADAEAGARPAACLRGCRVRCRGCGARGRAVVSVKWGRQSG